jgi:hypothetical protein
MYGLGWMGTSSGPCEDGKEILGSIKCSEFLEYVSNY